MTNTFGDAAPRLFAHGYEVTPLNGKRPLFDDWTELRPDEQTVVKWSRTYAGRNIGILTRLTPAIDIDVYDAEVAAEMEAWCLENLGDAPVRVGQHPKRLLLFRTDEPFRKTKVAFIDGAGQKHQVEVLADGQQFVAFGIHPDTKKPFEWVSLETPLDVAADDLPTISAADASRALAAFAEIASARGWTPAGRSLAVRTSSGDEDGDDLLTVAPRVDDLDDEDIRDALMLVPDAEDYDRWLQVGLALFHQFEGEQEGLDLWHEWSETAPNYDAEALDERWKTFDVFPQKGKPITFRAVLQWAKDGLRSKSRDEFERAKNLINACNDAYDLFETVVAEVAKTGLRDHQIDVVAKLLQDRGYALDGVKRQLTTIRKSIIKLLRDGGHDERNAPEWVRNFVWLESDDLFYSLEERKTLSVRSYNGRYDREMLTPEERALGVAIPKTRAADAARTLYMMQHADSMIYLPGQEQIVFGTDGTTRVNIYDDRMIPPCEEADTPSKRAALAAVQRHFEVLFPDQRDRELLISFLAYQVQCPSERVNWGVLIQGAEGAGKTWMQNLMACVLGPSNVGPVNPSSLFADFNGWAEGRKMIFVEEIRLRGHDRFEVLDKIKTNITNDTIEITRKGRDPYLTPNVATYVMFTNYSDAMSLSDNDRRYMVLQTYFQVKHQIVAFRKANPNHFADIYNAVAEHPGVLRGWLMGWTLHPEFEPKNHAPETYAKAHMRDVTMSEEQEVLFDLIAEPPAPDASEYLLSTKALQDALIERNVGVPKTSAVRAILEQGGFRFLDRVKVDGEPVRYYTRRPDLFPNDDKDDIRIRIRRILAGEEPEFL